ncbi:MAG TPA: PVC-type heme-binding CxxCH protein [Verrucomicrobiae bacterium]|nr:PVC-type heme-binding CxxCH protein [Verrucomicrobiae bacterium]
MLKSTRVWTSFKRLFLSWLMLVGVPVEAQHQQADSRNSKAFVAPASDEGELAIKKFQVPPGLKVDLWAAEPMLANPVAFNFDEKGRAYVCETFRLNAGVDDIRGIMDWLDEELASRSVDDRLAEMKRHLGDRLAKYSEHSERVSLLEDRDGDGKADHATVFAEGFNAPLDGIGAGVLARKGNVWYANIPNLWLLRDTNGDGVAEFRKSLHYGFGVRVGFIGHDLHGVHFGPDGKIYFSVGDRGSNVKVADGRHVGEPDTGCVFRCDPDGSELEVFSFGLRNPQDLVFDQYGNLFTGDNNSDRGDQARWVYVVEGGDNGWRVGYQFMERPYSRGPFNAEKLWYPHFERQAACIVPPIANIASGPSGVAYFPGTGLPDRFKDHFFLVDFRGGGANSGIHTFTLKPKGAYFELAEPQHFLWGVLATDVKFGVDGGVYVSDWVQGWEMTGKGRIYRVHDPALDQDPLVLETKKLLADGLEKRSLKEVARLLANRDMRVRQEAQFALADRGVEAIKTLVSAARKDASQLARLHAIWGLGQIAECRNPNVECKAATALLPLLSLLDDSDAEVRTQAAKVLGDRRYVKAYDGLIKLLSDASPRTRFFAAMSLGKLGRREALPAIYAMLRENADQDPYLRHAGVMALTWIGDTDALLAAAKASSSAVRMAALLAMRRLHRDEIAVFLNDTDPAIVLEAARAINDEPINGAMRELARLIGRDTLLRVPGPAETSEDQGRGAPRPYPGWHEALLRRVLNANFHFGTMESAKALAAFAARSDAAEKMRVEALEELADWPRPSGRDRVVGLWRPVAAVRQRETAIEALQTALAEILRSAPDSVRVAAVHAASRLTLTGAGPVLSELVADAKISSRVRVEALNALAALDDSTLEEALNSARADADEDLRRAATLLQGRVKTSNAATKLTVILDNGSLGEKQAALAALGALQEPAADDVLIGWLTRLLAGDVPKEIQLDLIEAAARRTSAALKEKLEKYQESKPKDDPIADYREVLYGGNAAEGKKMFFERPEASCVRCHKINGEGGEVGPDLSKIGAQKDRQYLLESVVLPNKAIAPGFESVLVTLKSGTSYAGVLKSETADGLVINSPEDGLVTVKKNEIKSRDKGLSPMPEGMGQILSKQDLRNLVEFLSGLK